MATCARGEYKVTCTNGHWEHFYNIDDGKEKLIGRNGC